MMDSTGNAEKARMGTDNPLEDVVNDTEDVEANGDAGLDGSQATMVQARMDLREALAGLRNGNVSEDAAVDAVENFVRAAHHHGPSHPKLEHHVRRIFGRLTGVSTSAYEQLEFCLPAGSF